MVFVLGCTKDEKAVVASIPTITTTAATSITDISATIEVTITTDGVAPIAARGVIWSTSTNPTIDLSTKTTDGTDTGSFNIVMTGLNPTTTYYVRAYATNSFGTAYSNEISFVTLKPTGITIGAQTWMTKNLDVSTYSDGTEIPEVKQPDQWRNLTTGAWCYYGNDIKNSNFYGKLYNWYAVAGIHDTDPNTPNKILAPIGWHIPSDFEISGSGLNNLFNSAGGYRTYCCFENIGANSLWWSISQNKYKEREVMCRISRNWNSNLGFLGLESQPKFHGLYVRCIKN